MTCEEATSVILDGLTDDPSGLARAELADHLARCPHCRAQDERLKEVWAALEEDVEEGVVESADAPMVTAAFARAVREQMRLRITSRRRRSRPPLKVAGWSVAAAAGFVVALVATHRSLPPASTPSPWTPVAAVGARPAPATDASHDPKAAPPHRDVIADEATPLPLPLQALANDTLSSDGGRLRAIALAPDYFARTQTRASTELIQVLARTLRTDRNPGVRLKAAEALANLSPLPEVRDAFIHALRVDPNPAVRLVAVDALARAARTLDPASIESLRQRANDPDEGQHLRTVAARALGTLSM